MITWFFVVRLDEPIVYAWCIRYINIIYYNFLSLNTFDNSFIFFYSFYFIHVFTSFVCSFVILLFICCFGIFCCCCERFMRMVSECVDFQHVIIFFHELQITIGRLFCLAYIMSRWLWSSLIFNSLSHCFVISIIFNSFFK